MNKEKLIKSLEYLGECYKNLMSKQEYSDLDYGIFMGKRELLSELIASIKAGNYDHN